MVDEPAVDAGRALQGRAREALAAAGGDPRRATEELLRRLERNPRVAAALTRASLRQVLADLVRAAATARGSPGMSTPPDAEWLPLPEAAALRGLSVRTLRRRIKAAQIGARRVPTPRGLAWQVLVLAPAREPARPEARESADDGYGLPHGRALRAPRGAGANPDQATPTTLVQLARDLFERNARLEGELAAARAELRMLRESAPAAESAAGGHQGVFPLGVAGDLAAPPRRPWWRRSWG